MDILDKLSEYRILLISKSPRRQYLLKEMGLKFDVVLAPEIKEEYPANLACKEIPVYLAKLKAQSFTDSIDAKTIIIAADTIVCLNDKVLGKPANHDDAVSILKKLSGRRHQVITGICIRSSDKETAFCSVTDVYFKELTDAEIRYYIEKYKPFDKAGSYGIQEWIGYTGIERIDGSYFNVMGLPTDRLYKELSMFVENTI